jgi:hypothetical protein
MHAARIILGPRWWCSIVDLHRPSFARIRSPGHTVMSDSLHDAFMLMVTLALRAVAPVMRTAEKRGGSRRFTRTRPRKVVSWCCQSDGDLLDAATRHGLAACLQLPLSRNAMAAPLGDALGARASSASRTGM